MPPATRQARLRSADPAAGALALLSGSVASIVGLYGATMSDLITLVGFGLIACLAGWYLWTQRPAPLIGQGPIDGRAAGEGHRVKGSGQALRHADPPGTNHDAYQQVSDGTNGHTNARRHP
jgi:hypothetical protein